MALSKPVVPDTVQDESVIAQHYLVCGTEDCDRNCQFYCNPCHQPMCEQCREDHQKSPDTKNHEMVPYQQRKVQLPVEKCEDHPTKDVDMICEDCQVPVCSRCVIQDHQKHALNDLETIYSEKFMLYLEKIYKIQQYLIPNSQDKQRDIKENAKDVKEIMDDIRKSMKTETESLKCLLETVLSDNIEQINKMEVSMMEELQSQDKTYEDYISYLKDLVKEVTDYMSTTKLEKNPFIFLLPNHLNIRPIPETTKPVPPIFTAGQFSKEDVTKLMGSVADTKPETSGTNLMKTCFKILRYSFYSYLCLIVAVILSVLFFYNYPSEKQTLSPVTIKEWKFIVRDVKESYHISLDKTGRLWVSDNQGNLVQTDSQGNLLQKIQTRGKNGYHTVTQDGDLLYTDKYKKVIYWITSDNTINEFIKTGDWEPISIHSSHINGDILVGMRRGLEAKVTRYDKTGTEIQNIQWDNEGYALYSTPLYITENINGDICSSDYDKKSVVVVNKSGQYRFSFRDQGSGFLPYGIVTTSKGYILVCDTYGKKVHLLDQDGQSSTLIHYQGIVPISVYLDERRYNLFVGRRSTNTIRVYDIR